jgi:hypothetical protein
MTEIEMTGLLLKLADIGVTGIKVKYEGSGDSGAIEWIGYTKELCETPEDVNNNIDDWDNDYNLEQLDSILYHEIYHFAENKILSDIEDWWNDEGGFGELCICVPSGKYIINNSVRIIDYEEYFHDGDLISKTL